MRDQSHEDTCRDERGPCDCLPRPVRMNYFHGQLISERDLRTEQAYFRDKLRHAHRCLHGHGVLCGMEVLPVDPPEDCRPQDSRRRKDLLAELARIQRRLREADDAARAYAGEPGENPARRRLEEEADRLLKELEALYRDCAHPGPASSDEPRTPLHRVRVSCGAAIDCEGNDVILEHERLVDVWALLKPSERDRLGGGEVHRVYLSICYEECGMEPTRPFAAAPCATVQACEMARVKEGAALRASLERPRSDERCDPCCTCCDDPCILLAALDVSVREPIEAEDIDHGVRRRFGLYDPTVISGISWNHGATYSAQTANAILGTRDQDGGIEIAFSRPVHVSTITPGTVELLRITGGRGLSGVIAAMEGEFVGLPDSGMVDRVRYRDATGETVQAKDRILIIVRAPFLLDHCCRPVEGLHVGGRVPRLEIETNADKAARAEEAKTGSAHQHPCVHPPHGPMPWTTSGPGNFESWFWVDGE